MYHGVKRVEARDDYKLLIQFDNGEHRMFDVMPLLSFGRFGELASLKAFRTARVAYDTVAWENGLDLDPEYLYENSYDCQNETPSDHIAIVRGIAEP